MPHETYFRRELPIYVDYIQYDQQWYYPRIEQRPLIISAFTSELSNSTQMLELLKKTKEVGLYKVDSLSVINEVYKRHYMKETTPVAEVDLLYVRTAQQIEDALGISQETFFKSAISKWSLYYFVTESKV